MTFYNPIFQKNLWKIDTLCLWFCLINFIKSFFRIKTQGAVKCLWHPNRLELVQHCLLNLFCCCHFAWILLDHQTHPKRNKWCCGNSCLHSFVLIQDGCLDAHYYNFRDIFACCICRICLAQHCHLCFPTRHNWCWAISSLFPFHHLSCIPPAFLWLEEQQQLIETLLLAGSDWQSGFVCSSHHSVFSIRQWCVQSLLLSGFKPIATHWKSND